MTRPRRRSILLAAAALLAAVELAAAACRAERTITARVPDAAMEGTLDEGTEVAVVPRARGLRDRIATGDIVLFRYPEDTSRQFVLRVAGLPGDTLEMRAGRLRRNGAAVDEPYATHAAAAAAAGERPSSRKDWGPLVVPPDDYFMLGDNRDRSLDSRYWGFVAESLIVGRVVSPRSR